MLLLKFYKESIIVYRNSYMALRARHVNLTGGEAPCKGMLGSC